MHTGSSHKFFNMAFLQRRAVHYKYENFSVPRKAYLFPKIAHTLHTLLELSLRQKLYPLRGTLIYKNIIFYAKLYGALIYVLRTVKLHVMCDD